MQSDKEFSIETGAAGICRDESGGAKQKIFLKRLLREQATGDGK